jgi:hypothetical protein
MCRLLSSRRSDLQRAPQGRRGAARREARRAYAASLTCGAVRCGDELPAPGRRRAGGQQRRGRWERQRRSRGRVAWGVWKRIAFSSPRHGTVGRGRDEGVVGWARRGYGRAGDERLGKKTLRFWQKRSPNYAFYGRSNFLVITQPDGWARREG